MINNLSDKAIREKTEDLLFTKAMALFAEEESRRILSEAVEEDSGDPKEIERIFKKTERKESLRTFWKYSKKILNAAAIFVFAAVISLSSAVVAFADVRESVAEVFYYIAMEDKEKYTQIRIGESTGFIDEEIFCWEGAFIPTYIPAGFEFSEAEYMAGMNAVTYKNGKRNLFIMQIHENATLRLDTENAEVTEEIIINGSSGLINIKEGVCSTVWSEGETLLWVMAELPPEEVIRIARCLENPG